MDFAGSVFMTVGDAKTPWHPQFFSAATFESQRLTQDCTTIDPSHGLRHCDVRIGQPREPHFGSHHTNSSFSMSFTLECRRLGQGWATPSPRISRNLRTFSFSVFASPRIGHRNIEDSSFLIEVQGYAWVHPDNYTVLCSPSSPTVSGRMQIWCLHLDFESSLAAPNGSVTDVLFHILGAFVYVPRETWAHDTEITVGSR